MMNNAIKAVLFDLDDTLFDHRHSMRTALEALQKRHEFFRRISLDDFEREHIRMLNEIHLSRILAGELTIDEGRELRFKMLIKMFGVDASDVIIKHTTGYYREKYLSVTRLKPGAYKLLEEIKKHYKVGIVTNNLIEEQKRKLDACGINHLVDVMITSEEAGVTKPDPVIFKMAINRLGSSPSNTVMIGDSWETDILGAYKLGMKCIWMNSYNEKRETGRIAVEINSFNDPLYIISLISN